MGDTTFIDFQEPAVSADWLNDVNRAVYRGEDVAGIKVFNVKAYPYLAVGDGVTDDSAAIQAAITDACAALGSVYFPWTDNHGYKLGSGLSVTAPIKMFGDSYSGSYLTTAADIEAIVFSNAASGAVLEDLQVIGPGTGVSTKAGVVMNNAHDVVLNRSYVHGWKYGAYYRKNSGSCYDCTIRDSLIVSNGTANIYCEGETNALGIYGTQFGGGAAKGLYFYESNSLTVIGGGCEGNTVCGIDIDTSAALQVGAFIAGVHFEGNTSSGGDIRLGATARVDGVYVAGCLFSPGVGADSAINAVNVRGLAILGNTQTAGYTGVTFLREGTIDGLVFQHSSETAAGGATRIPRNYKTPNALAPDAATTYDAAYSDSTNYNSYALNSGSLTAAKNFYAGLDVFRVVSSGVPGAASSAYARAMIVSNGYGASANARASLSLGAADQAAYTLTYSASITIPANYANDFIITATNGTAFTINAPVAPPPVITAASGALANQKITVTIRNTSGGALGAVTWNAVFKMAAWTQPANGYSRSITFRWDGTNWIEVSRTTADVPN